MAACDIECQRSRQLRKLGSEMVSAIQNKDEDPKAYEKARASYYTVKEGQGWVHQDKERQANERVQPILDSYQRKFNTMKQNLLYQSATAQAKQDLLNSQIGDEDEVRFVHSEIEKEREQASVYQRLKELQGLPTDVYSWLPSFLDFVLSIAILYVVYQLFVEGKLWRITGTLSNNGVGSNI